MYGHLPNTQGGHFTIHKFGNLVLHSANGKSGMAKIRTNRGNIFRNVIGIHKGSTDRLVEFDGGVPDPFWTARGIQRIKQMGKLVAEDIDNGLYDYISYDGTAAWNRSTADVAQRDFVYLRGPLNKEYVLLFDRVGVKNPNGNEKIWKIWVPAQPVFENGNPVNSRQGKWTSRNTNLLSVSNKISGAQIDSKTATPHGKFFLKTLAPENPIINVLGGPGKEYQSGDDDGTTPWGTPAMDTFAHQQLGWGRIEVRPKNPQNYDVFFNVFQIGDANALGAMSPVELIRSLDGRHVGAQIEDAGNPWVVMFSRNAADFMAIDSVSYSFTPVPQGSKHLITGMRPSAAYYVTWSSSARGATVTINRAFQPGARSISSTNQGSLQFSLSKESHGPLQ
jgi:hypothetical protein